MSYTTNHLTNGGYTMSNQLSSELIGKGMDLRSMTIDAPSGRVTRTKGELARCTVYFDKWTESGEGRAKKFKPAKGATLYTKIEEDAENIEGCVQADIQTATMPDGSKLRFNFTELSDAECDAVVTYKAKDTIDCVANDMVALVKKATCQAIMGLPKEDREKFAQFLGSTLIGATNILTSKTTAKKKARITLW